MRSPMVLMIVLAISSSLVAQTTPQAAPQSDNRKLSTEALLERIQQLARRISDLEARENSREVAAGAQPQSATLPQANTTAMRQP